MTMETYVAGFLFDEKFERVALIRKQKPSWQKGKLNGIGGSVELGEYFLGAMMREFKEETGVLVEHWENYASLSDGYSFLVEFFAARGDLSLLRNPELERTGETVEIIEVARLHDYRPFMIENLPWLISLAMDVLEDGRPEYTEVSYPRAA